LKHMHVVCMRPQWITFCLHFHVVHQLPTPSPHLKKVNAMGFGLRWSVTLEGVWRYKWKYVKFM
jgi:hypothetical protein